MSMMMMMTMRRISLHINGIVHVRNRNQHYTSMFGNRLGKTEEMKNDIQVSGTEITGPADEVISSEDRNGNGKQKRMGSLEWAWKVTGLGPWVRPLAVHGVVLQSQMLSLGPSQYFCQVYAYASIIKTLLRTGIGLL